MRKKNDILPGTLELLILNTLRRGPLHGYGIARCIEMKSAGALGVEEGSLYPALHRLLKRRWITFEEGTSENNRRAKFYQLTATGRKQLARETKKWDTLTHAITRILRSKPQERQS